MKSKFETKSFAHAMGSALDILGPVCKQRLSEYLSVNYGIEPAQLTLFRMSEIKTAITEIFGDAAAEILMKQIYSEIDKLNR